MVNNTPVDVTTINANNATDVRYMSSHPDLNGEGIRFSGVPTPLTVIRQPFDARVPDESSEF